MSIFKNFSLGFKKGLKKLNFHGRSSRNEILQISIITPSILIFSTIIFGSIAVTSNSFNLFLGLTSLGILLLLINGFASICAIGRRFQDMNLPGILAIPFIFLSPVIYFFIGILLLILPSSKNNKYGPNLENFSISSEALENYIYFKYFESNPIHDGMNEMQASAHNAKMANIFLKKISKEDKIEFDNIMNTNIINDTLDFSKSLPNLTDGVKVNEFVEKHNLQNINFQELFSNINSYTKPKENILHNKELNG